MKELKWWERRRNVRIAKNRRRQEAGNQSREPPLAATNTWLDLPVCPHDSQYGQQTHNKRDRNIPSQCHQSPRQAANCYVALDCGLRQEEKKKVQLVWERKRTSMSASLKAAWICKRVDLLSSLGVLVATISISYQWCTTYWVQAWWFFSTGERLKPNMVNWLLIIGLLTAGFSSSLNLD